jgi:hypothetical protein
VPLILQDVKPIEEIKIAAEPAITKVENSSVNGTELVFVILLLIVLGLVVNLGYTTFKEGSETEHTKRNAEQLVQWLEETGKARAEGKEVALESCRKDSEAMLQDCLMAVVAPGAPLANIKNVAEKEGLIFSPKCDREQLNTHGAIIVEKGTPKPTDPSALTFAAMETDEAVNQELNLRVIVCGRGFSVIKIAELKF